MRKLYTLLILPALLLIGTISSTQAQVSVLPWTEDFSGESNCNNTSFACGLQCNLVGDMKNDPSLSPQRWFYISNSGTGSGGTGPTLDHTGGGSFFIFTEASGACSNDDYAVISPFFNFNSNSYQLPELSFWYHALGGQVTSAEIYTSVRIGSTAAFTPIDTIDNMTSQNTWFQVIQDMSAYGNMDSVQFRVQVSTGTGFSSDIGLDDFSMTNNFVFDIGVSDVYTSAPLGLCSGTDSVYAVMTNVGIVPVTSYTLNYSYNGTAQAPINRTGINVPGGATDTVFLSGITAAAGLTYNIVASSSSPNGGTDQNPLNDTTTISKSYGLFGTYTIDQGGSGDFLDFQELTDVLDDAGLCGNITVNVAPGSGPYNGQVEFGDFINGDIYSITVNGNGNEITSAQATTGTLFLRNTQNISFDSLEISNTNQRVVVFDLANDNIEFTNCIFNGRDINSTSTAFAILYDNTGTNDSTNNITIDGCEFNDGSFGIYSWGAFSVDQYGWSVTDNSFNDQYENIVEFYYNDGLEFEYNDAFTDAAGFTTYGIEVRFSTGVSIQYNNLVLNHAANTYCFGGIYLNGSDADQGVRNVIANNMISLPIATTSTSGNHTGLYVVNSDSTDIFYNTVRMESGATSSQIVQFSSSDSTRMMNNNFVRMNNGDAMDGNGTGLTNDYNNFWAPNGVTVDGTQTVGGNSVSANPGFTSATDLHVSSAVLDGTGTPIAGITDDIDGDVRNVTTPDIGADEFTGVPLNLAATNLTFSGTAPYCVTTDTTMVTVTNLSSVQVNSFTLTLYQGATVLSTTAFSDTIALGAAVTVGVGNITVPPGAVSTFSVVVSAPNGGVDGDLTNDTASLDLQGGLVGFYTMNTNGFGDFSSFADLTNALSNSGMCAAVTVQVAVGSGPYNERVEFNAIPGITAIDPLTIEGQGEEISFGGLEVIMFNNAAHINLDSLTLTQSAAGNVIEFDNNNEDIEIRKSVLNGDVTSTTTSTFSSAIWETPNFNHIANDIRIIGNEIYGGSYGIHIEGRSNEDQKGIEISDNLFEDYYQTGIYIEYDSGAVVTNNTIRNRQSGYTSNFTGVDGIDIDDAEDVLVEGNVIELYPTVSGTCNGMEFGNVDFVNGPNRISNNMIAMQGANTGFSTSGINSFNSAGITFTHNSILVPATYTGTGGAGMQLNSFSNTNTIANNNISYLGSNVALERNAGDSSDYNNLYAPNGGSSNNTLGANSISGDPLFISATDLHALGAAANGAGAPDTNVTEDIDGEVRNLTTPDIGADEYDLPAIQLSLIDVESIGCLDTTNVDSLDITIVNSGTAAQSNFNVFTSIGGVLDTFLYIGTLNAGDTGVVTLTNVTVAAGQNTVTAFVALAGDVLAGDDTASGNVTVVVGGVEMTLAINTVGFGNEVFWKLKDATGTVIDSVIAGGYVNNSFYEEDLCVVGGTFTFEAWDNWSDGWNGGTYEITSCEGLNVLANNGGQSPDNGTQVPNTQDLEVSETFSFNGFCPDNDLAAIEVLSPVSSCVLGTTEDVTVVFLNTGLQSQTNVPLGYSLAGPTGASMGTGTTSGTTAPGETDTITFGTTINGSTSGVYTLTVWTNNTGDQRLSNDTLVYTFENNVGIPAITFSTGDSTAICFGDSITITADFTPKGYTDGQSTVLITEVIQDETLAGSGNLAADIVVQSGAATDPIEITNIDTVSVDIAGWRMEVLGFGGAGTYTFPANTSIPANSSIVLMRTTATGNTNIPNRLYFVGDSLPATFWFRAQGYVLSNDTGVIVDVTAIRNYNPVGSGNPSPGSGDWSGSTGFAFAGGIVRTDFDDSNNSSDWATTNANVLNSMGTNNYSGTLYPKSSESWVWSNADTTLATTVMPTASATYTITVTQGPCMSADSVYVDVSPDYTTLSPLTITHDTLCGVGNGTLIATSNGPGMVRWYADMVSTTVLAMGDTFVSPQLTDTTTYYASIGDPNCEGPRTAATVNIQVADQITASLITTGVICENANISLSASSSGTASYTYSWTATANGGLVTTTGNTVAASPTATSDYYVFGTDNTTGCQNLDTVTVNVTANPDLTTSASPASYCAGDSSTISVNISNSVSGMVYTYTWSPSTALASTSSASTVAMPASTTTYNVTVSDSNSCTDNSSVLVEVSNFTVSLAMVPTTCSGQQDGSLIATPSGAVGNVNYLWSNGASADTNSNLPSGPYTVTATDGAGCSFSVTDTVEQSVTLDAFVTSTVDVQCKGDSTADATVTVIGGTLPWTFTWSNGETTQNATFLPAGNNVLTVLDSNGCSDTATATIVEPVFAVTAAIDSIHDISSCGVQDGAIRGFGVGGTGAYSYAWSGGITATTALVTGLAGGNYNVTISDANGCTDDATGTIAVPTSFSASFNQDDVLCNGNATGVARAVASLGTMPYTYSWSNSATTDTIAGLTAGVYDVTVSDSANCSFVNSFTITEPTVLSVDSTIATDADCNGNTTGQARVVVSGGVMAYSYLWSNAMTTNPIMNLAAGTYTVTVTDANGCTISDSVVVAEPSALASTNTAMDVSCNGQSDGWIALDLGNTGTAPYTYSWMGLTAADTASGLAAGTYSVTVTDANGCSIAITDTVNEPGVLSAAPVIVSNVSCPGGNNGSIAGGATGGTSPFSYSWSTSSTADTISGLNSATPIIVTVTDANGCTDDSLVVISQPGVFVFNETITNVDCNGNSTGQVATNVGGGTSPFTITWNTTAVTDTLSSLAAGTYTAVITDANSCTATDSFTITEPTVLGVTTNNVNITCNGAGNGSVAAVSTGGTTPYTYAWSPSTQTTATITGLSGGAQTVTVTDANGCTTSATDTVVDPVAIGGSVTTVDVLCNGDTTGSATAVPTGGTGAYTYQWLTAQLQSTAGISGLIAGPYSVQVTDANGCVTTLMGTVSEPAALSVVVTSMDESCIGLNDGSATSAVAGGTAPYTYLWNNGDTTANVNGLAPGSVNVQLTDANGCGAVSNNASVAVGSAYPVSGLPTGTLTGNDTLTLDAGTDGTNYNWSTGATVQTITVDSDGVYFVTITNASGCATVDSAVVDLQITGIGSVNTANTISVYPNPTIDKTQVTVVGKTLESASLQIFDLNGRLVMSQDIQTTGSTTVVDVDLTELSQGVYMLELNSDGKAISVTRLVKE